MLGVANAGLLRQIGPTLTRRTYRVFISHSAHRLDEPVTQDFLDRLCETLSQHEDVEVLVDQRSLQAGDEWCQKLFAWMGLCDAAVVLLSPRAITRENSSWVPREVNLLMWRKALDANFCVAPVLVAGLKRSDIAKNPFVSNSRLTDVNFAEGLSDELKIEAIASTLFAKAVEVGAGNAFDSIQVFIEDSISRFAPQQTLQMALLKYYGGDLWQPHAQLERHLAVKMVNHSVHTNVDEVILDISRGSQPEYKLGERLFQALFPMRLPAEQSCVLMDYCQQQVGKGAVITNCHDTWMVRMMLRAATGKLEDELLRSWRILELPEGWGDDDEHEITRFLAMELAEAILGTGGWDILSEEPDAVSALAIHLADFSEESGAPILVCASFSQRWIELAPVLADKFPQVVFLLWSGAVMPVPGHVTEGVPPLSFKLEESDRSWNLKYRRKMQLFGGQ